MPKELWKTVLMCEENFRDSMMHFVDDYCELLKFYNSHSEEVDDATWVHVDEVREERQELEMRVHVLEEALAKRNEEYLELANLYRNLEKGVKPKKVLKKATKVKFADVEDDLPF